MLGSSEISESGVKVSSRILQRYVLRGEQVEVATRQHWAVMAEPVSTVLLSFLFIAWISSGLERAFGEFGLYLWWVWFALIFRLLWKMMEWRNEWFVATDKRLLLTYGLIAHKVAMMPLRKVTDMTYARSITGRFIGYGTFVLESAGQDQALQKIKWVPEPDKTYREICDIIFGPGNFDSEDDLGSDEDNPPSPDVDAHRDEDEGQGNDDHDLDDLLEGDPDPQDGEPDDEPEPEPPEDHESTDDASDDWQIDDRNTEGDTSGDWEIDGRGSSDDSTPSGSQADAGWQTSRESVSTYQRVRPRGSAGDDGDTHDGDTEDGDRDTNHITGPIRTHRDER